jgi:hypothetical protein
MALACSNISENSIDKIKVIQSINHLDLSKGTNEIMIKAERVETCILSDDNICVEFTGSQWSSDQIKNLCVYYQGIIVFKSCKNDDLIAECILNKGLANEAEMKYYSAITRENAAVDCNQANGILK